VPQSLLANLLIFARTLRTGGVAVRAGAVPDAVQALVDVGIARKSDVHDALRTVLVSRLDDLAPFDEMFERFWRVWPVASGSALPRPMHVPARARATLRVLAPGAASSAHQTESGETDTPVTLQTYSAGEMWRRKDFATFTPEDLKRAKDAMAKLAWDPGVRVTKRWISGSGRTIDLRRLLRVNVKHGGELISIPRRVRRVAPRPLILICDVSGSMEPYTRMLLLFAHAIAAGQRRVEVFVFSTRLTRVTRQFDHTRADAALSRVRDAVRDWSGGTRIGEAVRTFNTQWARRVLRRHPVVLLISDGWDLGDPELLGREIARLQRGSFRLIWLNPLLGSPGYEPLTRGMRAALPFVDDFLSVHDMSSIEALAGHLNTLSESRTR
jgi:uncharacterized protein with von Willebrand factor type A (vWA) domain